MADRQTFLFEIFKVLLITPKLIESIRDFILGSKKWIEGMPNLVVKLPIMSRFKMANWWPVLFEISTFLLVTHKPIKMVTSY